mgnify:CR=1 FL=1
MGIEQFVFLIKLLTICCCLMFCVCIVFFILYLIYKKKYDALVRQASSDDLLKPVRNKMKVYNTLFMTLTKAICCVIMCIIIFLVCVQICINNMSYDALRCSI